MQMKIIDKQCVLLMFLLVLCGCGTTPRSHIEPAATNMIQSTDVYILVSQKEITAQINPSTVAMATGGGLLFALIDVAVNNSRATDAEELIQPIRDALIDVDFAQEFNVALVSELFNIKWLNIENIELQQAQADYLKVDNYKASTSDAILFVDARYSVSHDFSSLQGHASIVLLPKSNKLRQYSEDGSSRSALKQPWHIDNNLSRDNISVVKLIDKSSSDKTYNANLLAANPKYTVQQTKIMARSLAKAVVASLSKTRQSK